jgi:hypothetical protein
METITRPRFSKARLLDQLQDKMDGLAEEFGFNPGVGWVQLVNAETSIAERDQTMLAVMYGGFAMLQDLIEDLQD